MRELCRAIFETKKSDYMSALRRIRQNMALIVIIIAIALLGFILTDFFMGLSRIIGGPPTMGYVDGEAITQLEYEDRVSDWVANSPSSSESQRNQLRDRAWTDIISEKIYNNEYEDIGLGISNDELMDLFAGNHQSPIMQQVFPGQTKEDIIRIVQANIDNPEAVSQLAQVEQSVARTRMVEKLANLVKASYIGSEESARRQFVDQNRKANISFLAVNYSQISDSLVQVSDADIEKYIRENEARYEQEAEAYVRYARFTVTPSEEDTTRARSRVLSWIQSFTDAPNDSVYTSNKSPVPYTSPNFLPMSSLPPSVQDSLADAEDKEVIGPVQEGSLFKLYKVVGTQEAETPAFKIKAIQVRPSGATDADTIEARNKARGIARGASADNFEDLMTENNGIEYGWYRKAQFGEDFDQALKNARPGQVLGPIKSNGIFHIVHVLDRSDREYDLAQVEASIRAGDATNRRIYQEANQFVALAQSKGNLNDAGSEANVTILETNALTETTNDILGLNGGRDIVLWAINAEVGDLYNEVFSVGNSYVCAQVSAKKPEGLKSVEDIRAEVEPLVRNQKKAQMIISDLQQYAGQDLNAIRDAYGNGSYVSTASDITFASASISGIGNEPYVIGRIMGMEQGATSEPLEGKQGVYIVQVTGVTEAEIDETTLATRRASMLSQGQNRLEFGLQSMLEEAAEVEDNRAEAYAKIKGFR
jgi:peptidyl-prolyl cis-trans isomerase D